MSLIRLLLPLLLLGGCGDLPQPFLGRPGANALRLAQPPPSRLAVPPPTDALLPDAEANAWSQATAAALVAQDLPASANQPLRGDWRLLLTARTEGAMVVPTYTVTNPNGEPQGSLDGPPVPMRDWAEGGPALLKAAATAEAPKVASLLASIEAHRQQSDPNSLLNRPPKLFLIGVTGAPGDGDTSLMKQMMQRLPTLGDVVLDGSRGADFTVAGDIKTAPGAGKTTRVEIQWIVNDARGRERGRVLQINEVPAGSLDSYWGEIAVAVATEAAGGVHDVVVEATGRNSDKRPDKDAQGKPTG